MITRPEDDLPSRAAPPEDPVDEQLLQASQHDFLLYRDQLALTERHLDALIQDTNSALKLLETLAGSFRAVEAQTSTFQAQCDDLLSEEERLQKLADEVGTDLHYYAYLDGVTRRLNAPGASRLVDHQNFAEILTNTDACIVFMADHVSGRPPRPPVCSSMPFLTISTTAHVPRCRIIPGPISILAYEGSPSSGSWAHESSRENIRRTRQADRIDAIGGRPPRTCLWSLRRACS